MWEKEPGTDAETDGAPGIKKEGSREMGGKGNISPTRKSKMPGLKKILEKKSIHSNSRPGEREVPLSWAERKGIPSPHPYGEGRPTGGKKKKEKGPSSLPKKKGQVITRRKRNASSRAKKKGRSRSRGKRRKCALSRNTVLPQVETGTR